MDFFNIGAGELVFLVLLAILLIGPGRAAQVFRQVTPTLAHLRREWFSFQKGLMTEINELEQETTGGLISSLAGDLDKVQQDVVDGVREIEQEAMAGIGPHLHPASSGPASAPPPLENQDQAE
ncbi:MAG: hypothetical protein JW900_02775 [Anaerolineae bacterium]|nr:hypothetical protein [Anaerolineae bacterium]